MKLLDITGEGCAKEGEAWVKVVVTGVWRNDDCVTEADCVTGILEKGKGCVVPR